MFTNRQMRRHPEMYGITFVNEPNEDPQGGGGGVGLLERSEGDEPDEGTSDEGDTDDDSGDDEGDEPTAAELDAETEAVIEARLAERLERQNAERQAEETAKAEAKAAEDRKAELKGLLETRNKTISAIQVPYTDDEGNPISRPLADFAIAKPVLDAIDKHDADLEEHFGIVFRETQEANMLALLPADARDSVQKNLDAASDYKSHAEAFGEAYAPHAKAIKSMDLDQLAALSVTATRQLKERELANKKAGRLQGQGDPVDEPAIGGGAPGKNMTYEQMAVGYGAGTLTDAQDQAYLAERAKRAASE